jgi:histidine triad (HIT) family protein
MDGCVFCLIAQKKVSAYIVYEDEQTIAFLDRNPLTRGHTVVIPKKHCNNILDSDEQTIADVGAAAKNVANMLKKSFCAGGINLISSAEKEAGQDVFHFHMHVIPRYSPSELGISVSQKEDKSNSALVETLRVIKIMNQPTG